MKFPVALGVFAMLFALPVSAEPIQHTETFRDIDWTSGGVAGIGTVGSGTITLSGVSGSVVSAFLYWHGLDAGGGGTYVNPTVSINGNSVVGVGIGDASTMCWGAGTSRAYRADVTAFVSGDGDYTVNGLTSVAGYDVNGASLVVLFDDGNPNNNRDLVFFEGNDASVPEGFPGESLGWHAVLSSIVYRGGLATAQFHAADGQTFADGAMVFSTVNGTLTIPDVTGLWDGTSVPDAGNSRTTDALYDIHTFDVSAAFGGVTGPVSLNVDGQDTPSDCHGLVLLLLDFGPDSAPTPLCGDGNLDAGEACDQGLFQSGSDVCPAGYQGSPICEANCALLDPPTGCTDVDECTVTLGLCGGAGVGTCSNLIGAYSCVCDTGYEAAGTPGDLSLTCVDLDECADHLRARDVHLATRDRLQIHDDLRCHYDRVNAAPRFRTVGLPAVNGDFDPVA